VLAAYECDAAAAGRSDEAGPARLRRAVEAARAIDAGAIAQAHPDDIAGAIRAARIDAVARLP
jgi:hypothetical protein